VKKSPIERLREVNQRKRYYVEDGFNEGYNLKYQKLFTQEYIAEELGVSIRTVGRWLRGESKPRKGQLIKIDKMLKDHYMNLEIALP